MQSIKGFTTDQTLEFLRAYISAPIEQLTWERYPVCTFIMMRFVERRTKILLHKDHILLKHDVWAFVAYWYDKLGYGLPIDACSSSKLFEYVADNSLSHKIEARKEFINRVVNCISPVVLKESNSRSFLRA